MENNELKKRTWFYTQQPIEFEIDPCECGNAETQWSEYEKHLWCDKCKKDFIPKNGGVLDSPVPMGAAQMLGLHFTIFNLKTNRLEILNKDYIHHPCFKLTELINQDLNIYVQISDSKSQSHQKIKAIFNLNELNPIIKFEENVNIIEVLSSLENFSTTINIVNPKSTYNLDLALTKDGFSIIDNQNYELFKNQIFPIYMNEKLLVTEPKHLKI